MKTFIIFVICLVSFASALTFWDSTSNCGGSTTVLNRNGFSLATVSCTNISVCNTLFNNPLLTPASCSTIKSCVSSATSIDAYLRCRTTNSGCSTISASYTVTTSSFTDGSTGFVANYFNSTNCNTSGTAISEYIGPQSGNVCTGICNQNLNSFGSAQTCSSSSTATCYTVSPAPALLWFVDGLF